MSIVVEDLQPHEVNRKKNTDRDKENKNEKQMERDRTNGENESEQLTYLVIHSMYVVYHLFSTNCR